MWPWWNMGVLRTSLGPLGTLGWEGQCTGLWWPRWDMGILLPVVPLDGKDRVTAVAMGVLWISHGPLGTLECSDRAED